MIGGDSGGSDVVGPGGEDVEAWGDDVGFEYVWRLGIGAAGGEGGDDGGGVDAETSAVEDDGGHCWGGRG